MARKKNNNKSLGIFQMPEKICVIGDIHADCESFSNILMNAGLINEKLDWTGRKTVLLVIGDLVDGKNRQGKWNGDSDLNVIKLVEKLMKQAKDKGGDIIVLLGNHEFMNIKGNFSYSGDRGTKEMGGTVGRYKYFNTKFKDFAKKCFLAVKMGDYVFCHAGILPEISANLTIEDLNLLLQKYLNGHMDKKEEELFYEIISGDLGILTNREFGNSSVNQDKLNKTLTNLKAKSMVVGHTVQRRVNSLCNGKLWRVDTGMSRAFGENNKKRMGFLLIYENGKKTKIF